MKQFTMNVKIIFCLSLFICVNLSAQIPQGFSFQGVAYNEDSDPLADADISVRIEILDGDAMGTPVYSEVHDVTTSTSGLYALNVGFGTIEMGQFESIKWTEDLKFIMVSIDRDNTQNYTVVGVNQLLSVPYALAAGSAPAAPQIYVRNSPLSTKIIAKNGVSFDGQGSIDYSYQWIDGAPEDVLVEVLGLPSNMAIYTNARGGFSIPTIKNASLIDTIVDGILKPQSFIGLNDVNIEIPVGTYPIELVFRTESQVLGTIRDSLCVF